MKMESKSIRFKDYLIDYLEFNNITNKDFANRIDVTQKHLIDILSGKSDISSNIIDKISLVTDIPADYIYRVEANYKFEKTVEDYLEKEKLTETQYLNKYNYKYLVSTDFIKFIDKGDKLEIIKDIIKFLRVSTPEKVYEIDKSALYKSNNDKPELLLLWLEKCYRETLKQSVNKYDKNNIDVLVRYIRKVAKNDEFNEERLIKKFNENGIYLVIQEDIPGSKIRGAFKVHRGIPAIYLTYKYHRIADVYFALLHELAHCKTDFNKAQSMSLVSYEDEIDDKEKAADKQAYDWMVDEKYYKSICDNKSDYMIEKEKEYPRAFVLYRLAKDKYIQYSSKEYQLYNKKIEKKTKLTSI